MWFCDHKESHVVAVERGDRYYPQLELAVLVKGHSKRITPILANICDLGFGEGLFDLVLFLGTLHHVGHQKFHRPIFEACYQALRPGGEMVVQTKTEMPVLNHLLQSKFTGCRELYTHGERTAWKGMK